MNGFKLRLYSFLIFLVLAMSPALVYASGGDAIGESTGEPEIRMVEVPAHSFNVYGHWLDGTVEFRLENGQLFADGWRVTPMLTEHELMPDEAREKTPEEILDHEVWALHDSLLAEKVPIEEVVAACRKKLLDSGLVESVIHKSGVTYLVKFYHRDMPGIWGLGRDKIGPPPPPPPGTGGNASWRLVDTWQHVFDIGGLVLISSISLPSVSLIPSTQRAEALRMLDAAKTRTDRVTKENWVGGSVVRWDFAEQQRRPLPQSRRNVFKASEK